MKLSAQQRLRYSRQLALPEIGAAGQSRLADCRVLVVGAGGLGCPAALYLAAAGLGTLGIADSDTVELSNLQRQILHGTEDVGRLKVVSAARALRRLTPDICLTLHPVRLHSANALDLLAPYEFVVDATDNFASKFLIADACHAAGKAYVHAGIQAFRGQVMTVIPKTTACVRCLFQAPPADASAPPAGPLGAVPGVIGTIQATEAVKYLLGCGTLLTNRLLIWDALTARVREVPVSRSPDCPLCGSLPVPAPPG